MEFLTPSFSQAIVVIWSLNQQTKGLFPSISPSLSVYLSNKNKCLSFFRKCPLKQFPLFQKFLLRWSQNKGKSLEVRERVGLGKASRINVHHQDSATQILNLCRLGVGPDLTCWNLWLQADDFTENPDPPSPHLSPEDT